MLENILQKLYTIEHIPSVPFIKNKLLLILSDIDVIDDSSIEELTRYLSYDPSLTLELLKIANSDSFGFKNKISSIHNALQLLDKDLIKLVISQHPVIPNLEIYHSKIEELVIKLIKHSIEVHVILQNILDGVLQNTIKDKDQRNELLTASTLHDIGFIFLLIYYPDRFSEITERMQENILTRAKKKNFELPDHSLISSIICKSWNLPASIRNSIAFHHFPWAGDEHYRIATEVLYLADSISSSFYDLFYSDDDIYTIEEHIIMRQNLLDIIERLDIEITKIAEIRMTSNLQAEELYSDLGLN